MARLQQIWQLLAGVRLLSGLAMAGLDRQLEGRFLLSLGACKAVTK